jgi:Fe-S oxidoreductase
MARKNVAVLAPHVKDGIPIGGTEPSCILTFRDEYPSLLPNDADTTLVAENAFMIDEFLAKLDADDDLGITWKDGNGPDVLFHTHCHQRSLIGTGPSMAMFQAAGCHARESGAGCCGMAGSFGYEAEHYDISRTIGEDRLFPAVNEASKNTIIAVAGVSCHQQIEHFTDRGTQHIAEVLASRIAPGHVFQPRDAEPIPDDIAPTEESLAHMENTGPGPASV